MFDCVKCVFLFNSLIGICRNQIAARYSLPQKHYDE